MFTAAAKSPAIGHQHGDQDSLLKAIAAVQLIQQLRVPGHWNTSQPLDNSIPRSRSSPTSEVQEMTPTVDNIRVI